MPGRSTRSASDASISNMSHPVSVIPNSQKSIHKRGDTDSGHGESESETHSRNHHVRTFLGGSAFIYSLRTRFTLSPPTLFWIAHPKIGSED